METERANKILTAPENEPYPERLENLLTIEEAAEIWNTPAATIRKKCKEGFFGKFARKMGGQWIITPEAMLIWKGKPQTFLTACANKRIQTWEDMKEAYKILNKCLTKSQLPREAFRAVMLIEDFLTWQFPKNVLPL